MRKIAIAAGIVGVLVAGTLAIAQMGKGVMQGMDHGNMPMMGGMAMPIEQPAVCKFALGFFIHPRSSW